MDTNCKSKMLIHFLPSEFQNPKFAILGDISKLICDFEISPAFLGNSAVCIQCNAAQKHPNAIKIGVSYSYNVREKYVSKWHFTVSRYIQSTMSTTETVLEKSEYVFVLEKDH